MNKPYLNVIVEDLADIELNNIYYYNLKFSVKNAIEVDSTIKLYINNLPISPYLGRCNLEMSDERYRERIYRKNRHSGYRIMYYISEKTVQFMCLTL